MSETPQEKTLTQSKKASMGLIAIGAAIGTGMIAVASGTVTGPVALPLVMDAIKWIAGIYLGAQGGQDLAKIIKKTAE